MLWPQNVLKIRTAVTQIQLIPINKENYKRYRNLLTTLIRLSRKLYYSSKLDSNNGNLSKVWQTISELIKKQEKSVIQIPWLKMGNEIKDPKEISNMF